MKDQKPETSKSTLKSFKSFIISHKLIIIILSIILLIIILVGKIFMVVKNKKEVKVEEKVMTFEEIFESFDPDEPESFNNAENLVELGPENIGKLLEKLQEDDIYTKWACLYALSRLGFDQD